MNPRTACQAFRGVLSSASRFMHAQRTPPNQRRFWTSSVSGFYSNAVRENDDLTATTQPDATTPKQEAEVVNADAKPLQFCVVGSGPAGFYTADRVRFLFWLDEQNKLFWLCRLLFFCTFPQDPGDIGRPLNWICYLPTS